MSLPAPATAAIYRWQGGSLELLDYCDMTDSTIEVADSWLVTEGRALAIDLHRNRFLTSIPRARYRRTDPVAFWDASIDAIPRTGDWFPRVELQTHGAPTLLFRLRDAPERTQSVVVETFRGAEPRTVPTIKGPDLDSMRRIRVAAQPVGADDVAILSPDGYVTETSLSAIAWWRGNILCTPPAELPRVDSVTARSLLGLATALGVELLEEAVTPAELDGTEVWTLNSLHGARIVTNWIDGPDMAELPGRLGLWRSRLNALAHPLPPRQRQESAT
jgi:branched-subunit amino acid aminotransferase/4-amino-4-deoxychorismate lyase